MYVHVEFFKNVIPALFQLAFVAEPTAVVHHTAPPLPLPFLV